MTAFNLWVTLYLISLVVASLLSFGRPGLLIAGSVLLVWTLGFRWIANPTKRSKNYVASAAGFLILAISVLVYSAKYQLDGWYPFLGAAQRNRCTANLREIVAALHKYESEHTHFPPPYVVDANGKPMHSWRVLILPYLGEEARKLYARYDFDEPWDGPSNMQLLDEMPSIYQCEGLGRLRDKSSSQTSYCAIVGPGTFWDLEKKFNSENVLRDKTRATLALLELHDRERPWTCPEDVSAEEAVRLLINHQPNGHVDKRLRVCCATRVDHIGRNVACVDGSAHWLKGPLSSAALAKQMVSLQNGDLSKIDKMRADVRHYPLTTRESVDEYFVGLLLSYSVLAAIALIPMLFVKNSSVRELFES